MLCVGPSHLDWNGQRDGVGKCFRHFWMQDSPQQSSDWRRSGKVSPEFATKTFKLIHFEGSAPISSNDNSGPSAPMALLPHAQDWLQQDTRESWREWMLCVDMATVVTNFNNSILLCLVHYLAWSCMPTTRYHEVFLCHPTCHYCFVSGGHLVRSHEPFLGNQACGLSWLIGSLLG